MYAWDSSKNRAYLTNVPLGIHVSENGESPHEIQYAYLSVPQVFCEAINKYEVLDDPSLDVSGVLQDFNDSIPKNLNFVESPLSVDSANYLTGFLRNLRIPHVIDYVDTEDDGILRILYGVSKVDCAFTPNSTKVLSKPTIDTSYPKYPKNLKVNETLINADIYKFNMEAILPTFTITHSLEALGYLFNEND